MVVGTQRARSGRWRETSPDARNGPIQEGRGAGFSTAEAGGGTGWGARERGAARATNRLLVSESRSKWAEELGLHGGELASYGCSAGRIASLMQRG
jgi:hypothetical protein